MLETVNIKNVEIQQLPYWTLCSLYKTIGLNTITRSNSSIETALSAALPL